MKTYEEILNDVIEYHFKNVSPKTVDLKKEAAKEYAKIWVKKALEETHETYVTATVEDYLNQIDKQ